MRMTFVCAFMTASLGSVLCLPSYADFIIGADSISSPQGELGGFPLDNIINQSGLSAPYISGVTDFDSYTVTTSSSLGNGFTGIDTDGPQQFTFDLGQLMTINGIAIWNTGFNVGAVNSFSLFADDDGDFGNGTTAMLLGPTALAFPGDPVPAQTFSFEATTTQFVHVNGLATNDPPDFHGLGEVAFSGIPEPTSTALLGVGLIAGWIRRQR